MSASNVGGSSHTNSSTVISPCGACKFLRRKCTKTCVFAPHFPPDQGQRFANVHKVFGASNVAKLLQELPIQNREDAVNSLSYEADARVNDPIYGCVGALFSLQQQVARLQTELTLAQAELARLHATASNQSSQRTGLQQSMVLAYDGMIPSTASPVITLNSMPPGPMTHGGVSQVNVQQPNQQQLSPIILQPFQLQSLAQHQLQQQIQSQSRQPTLTHPQTMNVTQLQAGTQESQSSAVLVGSAPETTQTVADGLYSTQLQGALLLQQAVSDQEFDQAVRTEMDRVATHDK